MRKTFANFEGTTNKRLLWFSTVKFKKFKFHFAKIQFKRQKFRIA